MKISALDKLTGFDWVLKLIGVGIECIGIAIIVAGAVITTALFIRGLLQERALGECYHQYRSTFGKAVLLGLEFLVASDIVSTVAVGLTFQDLGMLGLLVLIRTFLSFALEVEINGHWPWKSSEMAGRLGAK
ncbi:MAG: DUF1622 domain-containing protein [Deltaproteobacteria bacterium]|nr:DUF1622 domain-containing protein [Deltaproteobacteria bacterium]